MELIESMLNTHISYHSWATAEMWQSVRQVSPDDLTRPRGTSFGSLAGTLEHMYRVDRLWLARLNSEPALKLSEIQVPDAQVELESVWSGILNEFADSVALSNFQAQRTFVNSQGIRYEMPVWQIVLQVVNHGTGHRGQVTGLLRQLGLAPRGTDLVQYYRMFEVVPAANPQKENG